MRRLLLALVLAVTGITALAPPAEAVLAPVVPPTITGTPEYDAVLTAQPGQWAPAATGYAYQWLRDGQPVAQATQQTYRATEDDLGRSLSVQVTASDGAGDSGTAVSAPVGPVQRATLQAKGGQKIVGVVRFTHVLNAHPGRYSATPAKVTYQWRRSGQDIQGATGKRYEIRPEDVGARLKVQMTVLSPGHQPLDVTTEATPRIKHRVDVRRVVRYHVETRGRITTSVKEFRALAQATYDDARGWRGAGIEFGRSRGAVRSRWCSRRPGLVPGFSSGCSSMWSCRVGRFVIINQDRWKHASPAWNAANLALRDYRHMVVNHETGHWLGLGHAGCPGKGRLAPVMMQQSKGLNGCRFNPFPTTGEINRRTPHQRAMAHLLVRGYIPVVAE